MILIQCLTAPFHVLTLGRILANAHILGVWASEIADFYETKQIVKHVRGCVSRGNTLVKHIGGYAPRGNTLVEYIGDYASWHNTLVKHIGRYAYPV